jgi:hypothetical protein
VLESAVRTQPWLDALRHHVDELWPPFLWAFADVADHGHAALVSELEALHAEGRLRDRLPRHNVLGVEHAAALKTLIRSHGESDAGRIAQDLLAYLIALAGYRKVTLNPVGVPDFTVEERAGDDPRERVVLSLPRSDAERVAALLRASGDEALARAVESAVQKGS